MRSESSWALIDTAWQHRARLIKETAELLCGSGTRPASILLTHLHPDHAGSACELAGMWDLPAYEHPDELPLAAGRYLPEYANLLDRWVIGALTRILPPQKLESSLEGVAEAFDPGTGVPGLPEWKCIPTPGHTPGHVAFSRSADRALITGDALLSMNLNSMWDLLRHKQKASGLPYISTWNWPAAKQPIAALAHLEPDIVACGHGPAMTGAETARAVRAFANSFSGPASACPEPAR